MNEYVSVVRYYLIKNIFKSIVGLPTSSLYFGIDVKSFITKVSHIKSDSFTFNIGFNAS